MDTMDINEEQRNRIEAIRRQARQFIALEASAGRHVSMAEAVSRITREPSSGETPSPFFFRAASVQFRASASRKGRTFTGIAYAGGIITDHGVFGRVAFDLASTVLTTPAPAKLIHGTPIGVVTEATIDGAVRVSGHLFDDIDAEAKKVADAADRGMPWQMSVGIWPGRIETIDAGKSVQINGQTFVGPLTVYRNSRIREVSFAALGADDKTRAEVHAR